MDGRSCYGYSSSWLLLRGHGAVQIANCSCDMQPSVMSLFGWLNVCNAPLIPAWMVAVLLGLSAAYKFYSLGPGVIGSLSYSITFTMYSLMITSGLVVHSVFLVECGKAPVTPGYIEASKVDGSLSSSIAISFLFNALVDLKILPERAFGTVKSMVFVYAWVFYAYFAELVPAFQLYFSTIAICCSLYLLAQIVRMFAGQCKGVGYLLVGGAVGGVSLWLFYAHLCWLCLTFGVWSIEGVWYYGSDAAMFFIFLYAWRTRTRSRLQQEGDEEECLKRVEHM